MSILVSILTFIDKKFAKIEAWSTQDAATITGRLGGRYTVPKLYPKAIPKPILSFISRLLKYFAPCVTGTEDRG